MSFAKGKYAFGYCDKTGFRYDLKDLVDEVNNGTKTGFRVGKDVVDPDHPQNFVGLIKSDDPKSIIDARPDRTEPLELSVGVAQFDNFDLKISPIFGLIGTVTITTS